ncbi:TRAP transporter substrate-binding protein [Treponema parvum]|uniref:TRAP transporter substrate-binding protein n=1 Tax=Treponema parvum TaxID=138851 RepID=A0A975IFA5_9SPIR|nr:TRAP transporter substrate-binding protein [Treponema parvum]QTQ14667.1 TRAP transporter substrate-binding protein [Treponema parvum]
MKYVCKLGVLSLSAAMIVGSLVGCEKKSGSAATSANAVTFTVTADVTGDRAPSVEKFAKLVQEKTNGRYVGNVIAAGSLGTGADAAQMLQMGTLDVLMSDDMTMDGVLDGKLGFAWLPGLVADNEEARKVYDYGWIADEVANIMAQNQLIRISSYCNGFRQVGNIKRSVTEMADLKGMKIRTPSVASVVSFYEKCGALPVMISGSEVLNALQTGTVDGLDNAVFNYTNQGITDVIKHITELNYCYSGGCFIAGEPFWNKLSDYDKEIFKKCAQEVSDDFTKFFNDKTQKLMDDGVKSGQWTVDQPSDDMKAQLQNIYKQIWNESVDKYGHDIMDPIISGDYKKAK